MFERKLTALGFYSNDSFDYKDDKVFRNFISWLENQKIRLYKVEERVYLDKIDDDVNWPIAYAKYLNDLNINTELEDDNREVQIEKLLSNAIKLEYSDNIDNYNSNPLLINDLENSDLKNGALESIDYNSDDFKEGIHRLQRLLNIPSKTDDYTSVLQAISKIITDKLSSNAVQNYLNKIKEENKQNQLDHVVQLTLESIDAGFDTNDKIILEGAKILRLLHIKELRELQTKINEVIVTIQKITANPKTDSSLGKVGK